MASRVAGLAGPGEIVATRVTLDEAERLAASDMREVTLKGITGTVTVASVPWA